MFGAQQNQQQTQQHGQRGHHVTIQDLHEHIHHLRRGRGRSSSPGEGQPAHMYGHPLFRSSHGDIHRASTRHKGVCVELYHIQKCEENSILIVLFIFFVRNF